MTASSGDISIKKTLKYLPLFLHTFLIRKSYAQYICDQSVKSGRDFHFRGTALGGWLVLEPWITPSLFYQFLGASDKWGDDAKNHVALDSYSFCTALGPVEANRQLRRHWQTWVTEEHIANLSAMGVDTLRIPVADWMYSPYEPFIGCWDGALDELQRGIALCRKHGIDVMLDLHAMKDSQNGLDNSGVTANLEWIGSFSKDNVTRYRHWDIRGGNWAGAFNVTSQTYDSINMANIEYSLSVIAQIVEIHHSDPTVVALEPINEPTWQIPLDVLKHYYWESYKLVQAKAPHWITIFHDSFRLTPENWVDFMPGCPNYAFDSHIYQAWADAAPVSWFQSHACADGNAIAIMESLGIPVIVGEWSLAIDNCAMWLNGINDNVYGYPKVQCEMVDCPAPYFGANFVPNAPPDPTKGPQDPFGTGESYMAYGKCPRDQRIPNEDRGMRNLGFAKLYAFDYHTHGQMFWNFRTELEPRWDYMQAVSRGWLPKDWGDDGSYARQAIVDEMRRACHLPPTLAPTSISMNKIGPNKQRASDVDFSSGDISVLKNNNDQQHMETRWKSQAHQQALDTRNILLFTSFSAAIVAVILLGILRVVRGRSARIWNSTHKYEVIHDITVSTKATTEISSPKFILANSSV